MIKIEELSFGNHITFEAKIDGKNKKIYWDNVDSMQYDGVGIFMANEGKELIIKSCHTIKEIIPIKLTDKIINRFKVEWMSSDRIVIGGWLNLSRAENPNEWTLFICNEKITIKYVHQLQNFFSSVNKKLIIKNGKIFAKFSDIIQNK